jgi:hypothetical protein
MTPTPEIRLTYAGEQPRGPFPAGHRFGGVFHVWALTYDSQAWTEVKANRALSESEAMGHASRRVAMQTDYSVERWHRIDRLDHAIEFRAELSLRSANTDGSVH